MLRVQTLAYSSTSSARASSESDKVIDARRSCRASWERVIASYDLFFVRVRLAGCERFGWLTLIFLQIARCITRLARVAGYG